jgi:nickel transport protein
LRLAAWLLVVAMGMGWCGVAAAHGVSVQTGRGPAAWVRAEYSDGEAMSYAKVRVLDPQGQTFQVGNADEQGNFAWLPKTTGTYRVVMEDGQGHRVEASLDWSAEGQAAPPTPVSTPSPGLAGQPVWARAVWGLSCLFWLGGAWFWWKGRVRLKGRDWNRSR